MAKIGRRVTGRNHRSWQYNRNGQLQSQNGFSGQDAALQNKSWGELPQQDSPLLRENRLVADGIIPKTPAANVKRLKETGNATDSIHRALTEEEQKQFLKAVRNTDYYEYFAFLLLTGVRQGEASALYWGDVDWENNLIHVRSTLTFSENGHIWANP